MKRRRRVRPRIAWRVSVRPTLPATAIPAWHWELCTQGFRCEDLERLTFPDGQFDVVITQEVFEHVFDYRRAFGEVMRTLRSGGAHVFTTPKYKHLRKSQDRAVRRNGEVVHLAEPEYHGNPD